MKLWIRIIYFIKKVDIMILFKLFQHIGVIMFPYTIVDAAKKSAF